jgi:hypothetical protein
VINAAFGNVRLRFIMGIRIPLLELGFAIALARISLASVGAELWVLTAADLLSLQGLMQHACQSAEGPKVPEVIDLYCEGEPKDPSVDQGASVAVPEGW